MSRTTQELFDISVGGVIRQGGPSAGGGTCFYKQKDNGRKCAVGHCILPKKYKMSLEGKSLFVPAAVPGAAAHIYKSVAKDFEQVLGIEFNSPEWLVLKKLQAAHDDLVLNVNEPPTDEAFIKSFKIKAIEIAAEFGLDDRVIDDVHAPKTA